MAIHRPSSTNLTLSLSLSLPDSPANLIQDVANEAPDICHSVIKHKDVHVTWGQSVHLPCRFNGFIQESQDLHQLLSAQQRATHQASQLADHQPTQQQQQQQQHPGYIQWYYHQRNNILSPGYPVLTRRDKFILAADQGLVIMNANEQGWYQCRLGNQIIYSYNLIIDTSKCSSYLCANTVDRRLVSRLADQPAVGCDPDVHHDKTLTIAISYPSKETCAAPNSEMEFKRIYADWCREIERYKSAYQSWHAKQNVSCCSHER